MTKSKEYDFNALLATPRDYIFCKFEMRITAVKLRAESGNQLLPVSRGTGGNEMVEWLYNYHPEKARAIERKHKLYPDDVAA
jgi:hypothetical protein